MAYAAIACRCVQHKAMDQIKELMEHASNSESPLSGDGKHLSKLGVEALALILDEIAVDLDAELVVSDSATCAVEGSSKDRFGHEIAKHASTTIWPHWGASFTTGSFRRAVYQSWRRYRPKTRVLILITGNDVDYDEADASYIARLESEMDSLREYWSEIGLELIYLDGIAPCWQRC